MIQEVITNITSAENQAEEIVRDATARAKEIRLKAESEATVYLATSEKSNSAYLAIDKALDLVRRTGNQPVPLHLRNAPTKLMADLGYHDGYLYPHDYPGHYVAQQYMPDALKGQQIWQPQPHSASEARIKERIEKLKN